MSVFSEAEIDYLGSQRLGRLATVGHDASTPDTGGLCSTSIQTNPDGSCWGSRLPR